MNGESGSLPLFMTRENKYSVGIVLYLTAAVLYLSSNHFNFFSPQLLPMTPVDSRIPLLPYTVWVYLSETLFFAVAYSTAKNTLNLNKYFYSFLALQVLSVLIFCLWPTTYPREQFPLPESLDALTYYAFASLRQVDTPANCCPSLHVSSVILTSFLFLDEQKKKFPFFFLWAAAIAVATLTTKQHYLIDVVTGFFMATILYWVFHRIIAYRPIDFTASLARQAKR